MVLSLQNALNRLAPRENTNRKFAEKIQCLFSFVLVLRILSQKNYDFHDERSDIYFIIKNMLFPLMNGIDRRGNNGKEHLKWLWSGA